ncbi:MAG: TspO/MBR family protein [Balneolaceae bacterium]|nr:TspO/MBR family protein [Balneolaceae bacterium]
MNTYKQVIGLLGWLALTFAAAALAGLASVEAGTFYRELALPTWAPPAWLFGPVWTVLYLLMGVAAWLIWREEGHTRRRSALGLFVVQLGLNALWSWLFFAWELGGPAFFDICILLIVIAVMLNAFRSIHPLAAGLLVPYLLWVTFASVLNFAVWQMNPSMLG